MKLKRLNQRETYAVLAAAAFVILFVVLQFGVFPMLDWRERTERSLRLKESQLADIQLMKAEYDSLKNTGELWKEKIGKRPRGFTLFSFMDELAGKAGVDIAYMKPSTSKSKDSPFTTSKVELKLSGITLKQLTPFLHMVETSENMVFIRRISITRTGDDAFVDVVLQAETFEA